MFVDKKWLTESGTGILPVCFVFHAAPCLIETHGQDARATILD
jgi:hypothetical protein